MNTSSSGKGNMKFDPVESNATLARAYLLMERHQLPNLPVSSGGKVVGVISERDIASLLRNLSTLGQEGSLKVGNYMRSPVRSVESDTQLDTIVKLMIDERVNAVIVKKGEEVVGALTKDDLLEVFAELLEGSTHSILDSLSTLNANSALRKAAGKC